MNVPLDVQSACSTDTILQWLTQETRDERFPDNIFAEMLREVTASYRSGRSRHASFVDSAPQWHGARLFWTGGWKVLKST